MARGLASSREGIHWGTDPRQVDRIFWGELKQSGRASVLYVAGRGPPPQTGTEVIVMQIPEELKSWNSDVENRSVLPPPDGCPDCGASPDHWRFYEKRPRTYLALVAVLVVEFGSWVVRFRCRLCGKRITVLPAFAVPFANYVKETVLDLCEAYLEDDEQTYRGVVNDLGYDSDTDQIDERRPSHSMVWRWLSELGTLDQVRRRASRLIREKDPEAKEHRKTHPIPPRKYRSDARKRILTVAQAVIRAERQFVSLFSISFLPRSRTA